MLGKNFVAAGSLAVLAVSLCAIGGRSASKHMIHAGVTPVYTTSPYDGKTLFRGVFFEDGPAARLIADLLPAESASAKEGEDSLIEAIDREDSTFFDRFGKTVKRGDRVEIDGALQEGVRMLEAQKTIKPFSPMSIPLHFSVPNCDGVVVSAPGCEDVISRKHQMPKLDQLAHASILRDAIVDRLARSSA